MRLPRAQKIASAAVIARIPANPLAATCSNIVGSLVASSSSLDTARREEEEMIDGVVSEGVERYDLDLVMKVCVFEGTTCRYE
jgi:hypothetical protein